MKRVLRFLKWTGIVIVVAILGFVVFVFLTWDKKHDAPYPDISASSDSSIIARGAYLANGPAHCGGCHSSMDEVLSFDEGKKVDFKGGMEWAFPGFGKFVAPNITSDKETGIGKYSDAEIARSLRHSIGTEVKPMEYSFMYKAILAVGMIKPEGPKDPVPKSVERSPSIEYGKYLAYNVANCMSCHTEMDPNTGAYVGKDFAGKAFFEADAFSDGYSYMSPNLTPHKETGIMANWSEEQFIQRFHHGRVHKGSPMPWGAFSRIQEVELKALYRFFQSLEPVENHIDQIVFAPAEKQK
ncbi:MAG: cytochrome C [Saprospiraceae bacterium]|nr:cytochrome C [Saprospiraceae bacterium]